MIYEVCLVHKTPDKEQLLAGPIAVCAPDEQLAILYALGQFTKRVSKIDPKEIDVIARPFTTVKEQSIVLNPSAKHAADRQETLRIWHMNRPTTTTYTAAAVLNHEETNSPTG